MTVTWYGTNNDDIKTAHKTYWGLVWETWKMYGGAGNDTLTGGEDNDQLFGESGNDKLYGKGGNDYLDGGTGGDWMYGGTGDDTYIVDNTLDRVIEYNNQGYDTVKSYISFSIGEYSIERLELLGQAISGYGNSLNNTIVGNNLDNFLFGEGGNDTLSGGAGNDYLNGGTGADYMAGGAGNDIYIVDNVGDVVQEYPSIYLPSVDTVRSSLSSYTLTDYVENLELTGTAYAGYGNALNNSLKGNAYNNYLDGQAGNDLIIAGGGNDQLRGGYGSDTLIGDAGNDRLIGFGPIIDDVRLLEYDVMTGGSGADTFVLGDAYMEQYGNFSGVFYIGADYAHITDFSRTEGDKIEVVGNLNDYTLDSSVNVIGGSGRDTQIFHKGDLIAVVENVTNLSIANDFVVGEVPIIL